MSRHDRHTVRPTHRQRRAAARRRRNRQHDGPSKPTRRARRIAARESMIQALYDVPSMRGGRR